MMVCPLATPVPSLFAHTQCCRQLAGPPALFLSFGVYLGKNKRLHLQKNIVRFRDMIALRKLMEFRCEGILELFLRYLVIFVTDSSRSTSRLTRVTRQRQSCLWWWEQSTFVIQHIENEPKRKGNQTSVSMKNAGNPRRATPESRQTLSCADRADPLSLESAPQKGCIHFAPPGVVLRCCGCHRFWVGERSVLAA